MRTSNQVGRPWMLDGKMLRGATGTPMRRIDLANRRFAEADPEPLTLANLTTKSLTFWIGLTVGGISRRRGLAPRRGLAWVLPECGGGNRAPGRVQAGISACPRRRWDSARRTGRSAGRR